MAVVDLYVDGVIRPDDWAWFYDSGTSLQDLRNQVDEFKKTQKLTGVKLHLYTPGGSVEEGWAMDGYLTTLDVPIETVAFGQCASMGTVLFTKGAIRRIVQGTDFMIHLPSTIEEGNQHIFLRTHNLLVREGAKIIERYVSATGGEFDTIFDQMENDFHMTAEEAVANGFATEVFKETNALKAHASKARLHKQKPLFLLSAPVKPKAKEEPKKPETLPPVKPTAVKTDSKKGKMKTKYTKTSLLGRVSANAFKKGRGLLALDVNIEGGGVLEIDVKAADGVPAKGDPCKLDGATAPDNTYVASEDQTEYVVAGGVISEINDAEEDAGDTADTSAEDAKKDEEITALKKSEKALKAKVKALEDAAKKDKKVLAAKSSKPVAVKAAAVPVKPVEEDEDEDEDEEEEEEGENTVVDGDPDEPKAKGKGKLKASQWHDEKHDWRRAQMKAQHQKNKAGNLPDKVVNFDKNNKMIA